jgi:D-glycero-D-manno-heptose 1,7-bisphosphate phosphatase
MPVQVEAPTEHTLIPGAIEALRLLNQARFICPIITVQTRIEKRVFTEAAFRDWFATLEQTFRQEGVKIHGLYVCPHRSNAGCICRKPQPTLYLKAAEDLDIDCSASYVVGDTSDDILAGKAIGAKPCFVRTGWAYQTIDEYGHLADFIGDDILEVARWIVNDSFPRMIR